MRLNLYRKLATITLCSLSILLSAQPYGSLKNKEEEIESLKAIRFLNDGPETLSQADIETIGRYNFESYRKKDQRCKIQLVNGPTLELLSENEILQNWIDTKPVNNNVDRKKATQIKEPFIQLNIGLGNPEILSTETTH